MTLDALPALLTNAIARLDRHDITSPQMPVERMLFYARDVQQMLTETQPYRQGLLEVGLPQNTLEIFELAVIWAQKTDTLWQQLRNEGKSDALIALEQEGIALRGELVAACRFYLRRDPSTQLQLKAIMYGEGIADLILDLNSLASLIRSNRRAFSKHGYFDPGKRADEARDLIARLRQARWEAEWDEARDEVRVRRDELFTLLHLQLIDVCVAGQLRFHDDPEAYVHFLKAEPPPLFRD